MLSRVTTYFVLALIIVATAYLYYDFASFLEKRETTSFPTTKGYVSDEVWYVNSARNLLRKIFDVLPFTVTPRATLIFDSKENALKAAEFVEAYNVRIIAGVDKFNKLNAIYVEAQSIEAINQLAKTSGARDIVFGWILGDAENINNYLNLEHPPTAKYIIALFMFILGDNPLIWRIPSIIMGVMIVIFTFLITHEITKSYDIALIASAAVSVDPLVKTMSSIALLDVYVAAFTTLVLYLALKGRFKEAVLVLGFASTFKFTALVAAIPLLFMYLNHLFKKGFKLREAISGVTYYVILMILSFTFFQILLAIPIILKIGIKEWLSQGLLGAISWHLSAKCVDLTKCPIYSAPWEWFFGVNSFVVYLSPKILAQGFVPAYALGFVLMIFSLPSMSINKNSRQSWYMLLGLFLGYLLLWIAGSRTQYSFYAIQISPIVYIYLVSQLYEYANRENIVLTLNLWKKIITNISRSVLSIFI